MLYNKNETKQAGETGSEVNEYSNLLNQFNLHPMHVEGTLTLTECNDCVAIGTDVGGSTISPQKNHVQENHGVTGISGTGHTINIYQYPKELIEVLDRITTELRVRRL
jgi:hypothetical protein